MAGEPRSIGKILNSTLEKILQASENEYITITHIRATTGSQAASVTASLFDYSTGATINLWNSRAIKANSSEDIYVAALEPGDSLNVSADLPDVHLMVQYESSKAIAGGGANPNATSFAFLAQGYVTTGYYSTDSTEKYEFATDLTISWIGLANTRNGQGVVGNTAMAVCLSGYDVGEEYDFENELYYNSEGLIPNDKYIYATAVSTTTTALGDKKYTGYAASFSSLDDGYVAGGYGGDGTDRYIYLKTTYKFEFATEIANNTRNLSIERGEKPGAAGNSAIAIVAGGFHPSDAVLVNTEKFIYANQTYIDGATLSAALDDMFATSNSEYGIFSGNYETAVTKYVFANDSVTSTSSLTSGRGSAQATSNSEVGLVLGGETNDLVKSVEKFNWVSETFSAGTNLTKSRGYGGAVSSTPGYYGVATPPLAD